ncbi:hypothetical protein JCGZ_10962 [Jatropha curcas]|uniref:Uncharacterized protein n=1 Tax=Jatropha curcas TaxID=180498 RepID=A0A067LH32_JATCU|nr:hypothetical protein JCGZ_10962 [Jatropha curcas]
MTYPRKNLKTESQKGARPRPCNITRACPIARPRPCPGARPCKHARARLRWTPRDAHALGRVPSTPVPACAGLPETRTPQAVSPSTPVPACDCTLRELHGPDRVMLHGRTPAETTDDDAHAAADTEEDQPPPFPGFSFGAGTSAAEPSFQGTSTVSNDELLARMLSRMDVFDTRLTGMESMITDRF